VSAGCPHRCFDAPARAKLGRGFAGREPGDWIEADVVRVFENSRETYYRAVACILTGEEVAALLHFIALGIRKIV
jgi:hypothetical protein